MPQRNRIRFRFASAVCHARVAAGLTQQWVADYLDRGTRWVQKIEAGTSEPNLADAIQLMALFDIKPIDILISAGEDVPVLNR